MKVETNKSAQTSMSVRFVADGRAFNMRYTLRRSSGLAGEKRSRPTAFVCFFSGTFLVALETYGFLYRATKNVV